MDLIVQIFLLLVTALSGYFIFKEIFQSFILSLVGAIAGIIFGYIIVKLERRLKDIPLKVIVGSLLGIIVGLVIANLFISKLLFSISEKMPITLPIYVLIYFVMGYLGFRIGVEKSKSLDLSKLPVFEKFQELEGAKILDTSAIIDGRIADVVETGFIEGTLVIPQFVLYEIQHIADSPDHIKRVKGRRGLEILHRLQKQNIIPVKIVDYDFPKLKDVDMKLIAIAKRFSGKIVTNDYNLNKVAELQGIEVLNINQLAYALKPPILPGEPLNIRVVKEGKEFGQGIGYLEDGTMVVIEDGRRHIGKNVDIIVTSVLQTPSGRMVFGKLKEHAEREFYFPDEYRYEEQIR
ncbi:MAG: TRAM domain-containing protein [Desulfobacterota bacterium]|nr:TRAM domain-containing protein [Thermodesulfobacteriota bacterium]MDW8002058.1 TRAM domain-containing protein [Deltaproteobacteria bacterium]